MKVARIFSVLMTSRCYVDSYVDSHSAHKRVKRLMWGRNAAGKKKVSPVRTYHRRGGAVQYPTKRKPSEPPLLQARFQKVKESDLETMSPASLEFLSRATKQLADKVADAAQTKGAANTMDRYTAEAGPSTLSATEQGPHRRSKRIAEKGFYDEERVRADPRPREQRIADRREVASEMMTPVLEERGNPKVDLRS